jgi:hypothetical protein
VLDKSPWLGLAYRIDQKPRTISLTRIEIGEDGRVSWLKESPQVAKESFLKNFALVTWVGEDCVTRGPFKILANVIRETAPIRDMVGKGQLFCRSIDLLPYRRSRVSGIVRFWGPYPKMEL